MTLSPDTRITPRVRLRRELGRGGMGSVWVARHEGLDSDVAVKFIAPKHVEKSDAVERFRREASTAAKLANPHVVKVFDHGVSDDGHPFIVMELLKGESLSQRIARKGPLGPGPTSVLVTQVAKVLTEAHALGIVHRDLKPANLFLVASGYELFVKVLDFGIAKQTRSDVPSELTETGAMVGTPHFMSPEMLMSTKAVDERADLWALAVVAYVCLTGRPPFDGETLAALSVAIHEGRFDPPSSLVPGLTPAIDAWFKVALCRAPGARFSSADLLASELEAAVGELEPEARWSLPSSPVVLGAEAGTPTPVSEDDDTELGLPAGARDDTTQDAPLGTLDAAHEDAPHPAASVDETVAVPKTVTVSDATLDQIAGPRRRGWLAAAVVLVSGSVVWAAWPERPERRTDGDATSAPSNRGPTIVSSSDTHDDFVAPSPLTLPTEEVSVPAPTPAPAPARAPVPVPAAAPPDATSKTPPAPASSRPTRPPYCDVTPFSVNAEGDIVPKPECFPVK